MGKLDKFKAIFDIAAPMVKPFVPGAAGTVLDAVTKGLASGTPSNASAAAIKELAADNDAQTQAILALTEYAKDLEARIVALELK